MYSKCGLFPYNKIRPGQGKLIACVEDAVNARRNLAVHAPTGIGKTVSVLAPALEYAIEKNKTVFFLAPRHTQHRIVIDTLSEIQKKCKRKIRVVNIIGKKWLCKLPNSQSVSSSDLQEVCKSLKKNNACKPYKNVWNKKDEHTQSALELLSRLDGRIMHLEDIIKECGEMCPYEILMSLAKTADVIVADYYHIFNPAVQTQFFNKCGKSLADAIIIVDEAHNLPKRIRDLFSAKLTSEILRRAIKEADRYKLEPLKDELSYLKKELEKHASALPAKEEYIVKKEIILDIINNAVNYNAFITDLLDSSDAVKNDRKISYMDSVARFLLSWLINDDGYARILRRKISITGDIEFSYNFECLDSSVHAGKILSRAYSTIIMSGTLTPVEMYADVLGLDRKLTDCLVLESPFPKENRLNLIVDNTTTKYTRRNEDEYFRIAKNIVKIIHNVPGNICVFFPSYTLRDEIYDILKGSSKKEIFFEYPDMTKSEKKDLLDRFKKAKDKTIMLDRETFTKGGVLFGVIGANFSEGVDFPGGIIKSVVIVGLPLEKVDLKTQALINYFDAKYKKGWDYGYIFPAINKTLQAAGRCIRSETDYGAIVFMDSRYLWDSYKKALPHDMQFYISNNISEELRQFFSF